MSAARVSSSEDLQCPICGGESITWHPAQIADPSQVSFTYTFSAEHSKTFQVQRCTRCSHAFCAPIPADIARYYEDVVDDEYLHHEEVRAQSAMAVLRHVKLAGGGRRLLDVGCATGDLIAQAASMGFESEGLELSTWSSEIAAKRGLRVHRTPLESFADRHRGEFDVVTLMGVIEHFADPVVELTRIRGLLRPGGLVVLWTGDVDSVTSRILGRKWWYWQGQHIQYFTRKSLLLALAAAGFDPPLMRLYPFASTFTTISNSLQRYRLQALLRAIAWPFYRLKRTWYLYLPGEMLALARRP